MKQSPPDTSLDPTGDFAQNARHRKVNYDLHEAIDRIKLSIVLKRMVADGILDEVEAKAFDVQAACLLASICHANDRHFGKRPKMLML